MKSPYHSSLALLPDRRVLIMVASVSILLFMIYTLLHKRPSYKPTDPKTILAQFSSDFMFGLATAPAHVEDSLDDGWLEWGLSGKIPFFLTVPQPERRLDFYSNSTTEISLAAGTGISVFRMGIDWGRLVPFEPGSNSCLQNGMVPSRHDSSPPFPTTATMGKCRDGIQNYTALETYLKIMKTVKSQNMQIMLSIFHHSPPKWSLPKSFGCWTNPKLYLYFLAFVRDLIPNVSHLVDQYIIFNEPAVYANLVFGANMWPGRLSDKIDGWAYWNVGVIKGYVIRAFENMVKAHSDAYDIIKSLDKTVAYPTSPLNSPSFIGIAHNVAWYLPGPPTILTTPLAGFIARMLNTQFLDMLPSDKLDFIGINYYGKEYLTTTGSGIMKHSEYSESGRAISPEGFHLMLSMIHDRYNVKMNRTLPILITENGISDATDVLRPSYLIEHLLAVKKAQEDGIPIIGYIFWTISDNMEWADGFCPKFGLVDVNRATLDLHRTPRSSYFLFRDIVKSGKIILEQRVEAWSKVVSNYRVKRPFCRSPDGRTTVKNPTYRPFASVDWRFNYKLDIFPPIRRRWPWGWLLSFN